MISKILPKGHNDHTENTVEPTHCFDMLVCWRQAKRKRAKASSGRFDSPESLRLLNVFRTVIRTTSLDHTDTKSCAQLALVSPWHRDAVYEIREYANVALQAPSKSQEPSTDDQLREQFEIFNGSSSGTGSGRSLGPFHAVSELEVTAEPGSHPMVNLACLLKGATEPPRRVNTTVLKAKHVKLCRRPWWDASKKPGEGGLEELRVIKLYHCSITPFALSSMGHATSIVFDNCCSSESRYISRESLKACSSCRQLVLRGSTIRGGTLAGLEALKKLQDLQVRSFSRTVAGKEFAVLAALTKLTSLSVCNCRIAIVQGPAVAALHGLKQLQQLELVSLLEVSALVLCDKYHLRIINTTGTKLHNNAGQQQQLMRQLGDYHYLEELKMQSSWTLRSAVADDWPVRHLTINPGLKILDLGRTAGAAAMAGSMFKQPHDMTALVTLNLAGLAEAEQGCSVETLQMVLKMCPQLRSLNIQRAVVGGELCRVAPAALAGLTELHFSGVYGQQLPQLPNLQCAVCSQPCSFLPLDLGDLTTLTSLTRLKVDGVVVCGKPRTVCIDSEVSCLLNGLKGLLHPPCLSAWGRTCTSIGCMAVTEH